VLEVGVSPSLHPKEVALTHTEARSHFGAWAITSSPLILGLDVRDSTVMDNVWDIISNKEALAVNEEYAGSSGLRIASSPVNQTFPFCGYLYADGCSIPSWELFSKPLLNGAAALLFINHGDSNVNITINTIIVPGLQCSQCNVRDIWQHQDLGSKGPILTINELASHDSVFYTLH
jgi:alpha-galactosidase